MAETSNHSTKKRKFKLFHAKMKTQEDIIENNTIVQSVATTENELTLNRKKKINIVPSVGIIHEKGVVVNRAQEEKEESIFDKGENCRTYRITVR